MKESRMTRLSDLTTLRIGGEIATYVEAASEEEIIAAVQQADDDGAPLLVLGGGSNVVASDERFEGVVVRDVRTGMTDMNPNEEGSCCGGAALNVVAGQPWDDVVQLAIAEEWMGIEALSGIPGSTGATPIQNVGAYGQEVAETLSSIRVWDRLERRPRLIALFEMQLGYRDSMMKRTLHSAEAGGGRICGPTGRYVVLDVNFSFRLASLSAPIRYAELARTLDVAVGERVPSSEVRKAVLQLRRGKGMVLDAADHDTWSAGSFFTNPILSEKAAAALPADAPRYEVRDHTAVRQIGGQAPVVPGLVKTSAAWLIDHAGFTKGFGMPGPAALSTKHVLALTNRGTATASDIRALADQVQKGVADAFGVELVPEPVYL